MKTIHSRLLSILIALCLLLSLAPFTVLAADTGNMKSGDLNRSKPTKTELLRQWNSISDTRNFFFLEPSTTYPHQTGVLEEDFLVSGLDYLNFLRTSANLPAVQLGQEQNESAQYGAVLLAAINQLTHYPKYPGNMDYKFFEAGSYATRTSNLSMRTATDNYNPIHDAIHGCMVDRTGLDNLTAVGHRIWLMEPKLLNVGFGYARNTYARRDYVTTPVLDSSGPDVDYNFLAWPASGNMLRNVFTSGTPWSILMNEERYERPNLETLSLTVTRESDGKVWVFDKNTPSTPSTVYQYLVITNDCIIFNPGSDDIGSKYEGIYTVSLKGISTIDGKETEINYQIDFFSTDYCSHSTTETVPTVAPTCATNGSTESVRCRECWAVLEEGSPIPATGHSDNNNDFRCDTCNRSLCTTHVNKTVAGFEPTCTEDGLSDGTICANCEVVLEKQFTVPALGHSYEEIITIPNSCSEGGLITYVCENDNSHTYTAETYPRGHRDFDGDYVCDTCNEILCFRHIPETVKGYPATCRKEGLTDGTRCANCKAPMTEQTVIPKTDHTIQTMKGYAATCSKEGLTDGESCSVCTLVLTEQTVIPTTDHTSQIVKGKEATCTRSGLTNGESCSVCKLVLKEQTEIPATGHDPKNRPDREPTCTNVGVIGNQYCGNCGVDITKLETIPALGHDFVNGVCQRCGKTDGVESPFADVAVTDWFFTSVLWAVENNITGGIGNNCFGPNNPCTRGQVVTFLWAAAGKPEPETTANPFTDVFESDYYYKAVLWAVENGITAGSSPTTFSPTSPCTRGHVVTFLWAAAGKPMPESTQNEFADVFETDYYCNPVLWAVENEITSGVGNNRFGPDNTCTRSHIVTFLYKANR